MKERPILFSAPMVRALLDGRKTMTRRVVKDQPEPFWTGAYSTRDEFGELWWLQVGPERNPHDGLLGRCPFGVPGDRLWVKEAWQFIRGMGLGDRYVYRADGERPNKWVTPMFMPRAASRLTLEIAAVRVEQLRSITDEDAVREGVVEGFHGFYVPGVGEDQPSQCFVGPRYAFGNLWNKVNGPGAWDANPWVWAIEFKVVQAMRDRT